MATTRITVSGGEAEAREQIKEQFFKKLYQSTGNDVTFEVPEDDEAGAQEIVKAAEEAGLEAKTEKHEDPLEDAAPADFW